MANLRITWIDQFGQDFRYALRGLMSRPLFTGTALLCLALGIGANSAVFSLLNFVYLRPLPVHDQERLVIVRRAGPLLSYPEYIDLRDRSRSLAGVAVTNPTESSLDFDNESHVAGAEAVSANYARVIGVGTFMGRWFSSEDESTAVLGYSTWQNLFHSDPHVLGKVVRSEKQWYTIVGVAPRDFGGTYLPLRMDLWLPLGTWARQYQNIQAEMRDRRQARFMVFGHLRPHVTAAQAAAELNGIQQQRRRDLGDAGQADTPLTVELVRGIPNVNSRRQSLPVMALLMSVVALVLLIACVNVGNLLMARGAARGKEFAIRLFLGASRGRVLRQVVTESLLIALSGSALGLAFGAALCRAFEAALPAIPVDASLWLNLSLDWRVVLFTTALSVATPLFFGVAPAWWASRTEAVGAMNDERRPIRRLRLRQFSTATQVCLSMVLLLISGLFVRALSRLSTADPGFRVQNRIYATTYVAPPEYDSRSGLQFYNALLDRLRAVPGVRSAGLTRTLPLTPINADCAVNDSGLKIAATTGTIGAGFLATMQIPLLAGRDFDARDRPTGTRVAIVNESCARRLWPGRAAIGERIRIGCREQQAAEVVGLTRDFQVRSLGETPEPNVYLPFSQNYEGLVNIVVEVENLESGLRSLRQVLRSSGAGLRVFGLKPLRDHVEASYWQVRWETSLLTAFGALAILLAAIGLYGVMAYHVVQRTREIGIRMAIGATASEISAMVLREGFRTVAWGILPGLAITAALGRGLTGLLYGMSSIDPLTYVTAVLVWCALALLASYGPARRAARIAPIIALRHE